MAKYHGAIGYSVLSETSRGVSEESIVEHVYYGDIIKNNRKLVPQQTLNDDISVSNQISIVADPFANNNFYSIRYATWMGTRWKVTNVDVQYPRLILTLGGVYNGNPT